MESIKFIPAPHSVARRLRLISERDMWADQGSLRGGGGWPSTGAPPGPETRTASSRPFPGIAASANSTRSPIRRERKPSTREVRKIER
eukprot:scaffold82207_cov31-Tisochrysis_lutea.AAC.2